MENERLNAKVIKMEENLEKEKSNAKSAQEVFEFKIKASEEEWTSQKKDNDKLSKMVKVKDTTIGNQNLKIFYFEKKRKTMNPKSKLMCSKQKQII